GSLRWMLRADVGGHPIGEVFYAPFDVVFSDFDGVEPDLLYISRERAAEVLTSKHVKGTPDLVIEIGSPGTRKRDETIKRRLYERSGGVEYWIGDPEVAVIRVSRLDGDTFARAIELALEADDVLARALLPGFTMPLRIVFKT